MVTLGALVTLVVHRAISRFLLDQAGLKAEQADSGAVTLIRRFGSAANLNIHLRCLVLDYLPLMRAPVPNIALVRALTLSRKTMDWRSVRYLDP